MIATSLAPFVNQASRSPQLSTEEELSLARSAQSGDRRARERLARANVRHVVTLAIRLSRYGIPVEDLVSEGMEGLSHALDKFDPSRKHRFVTYASYWIRAYQMSYIIDNWRLVGGGQGALRSVLFFKVRRDYTIALNSTGNADDARRLLAEKYGVPESKVATWLEQLSRSDLSLDVPVGPDGSPSWTECLPYLGENPEEQAIRVEESDRSSWDAHRMLASLSARERTILERNVMSDSERGDTLHVIGCDMDLSRERVRQIRESALDKLRSQQESSAP